MTLLPDYQADFTGKCVLCGAEIPKEYAGTHNPWPLSDNGRACLQCNTDKVIPARLRTLWARASRVRK